jgi:hypothetical protein
MALQANHQVKIPGADKTQATALAIEFWTSKGFIVHSSSYNCIVLHRNAYGSFGKLVGRVVKELVSEEKDIAFDQIPTELTVLCQVLPKESKWDLSFKLAAGYEEKNPGDFSSVVVSWCNEFSDFCRQWMNNAD